MTTSRHTYLQKITPVLIMLGAALSGAALYMYVVTFIQAPSSKDPFELGQYYFNHDDDPAGEYDLKKAEKYYKASIAQDPDGNELAWYQLGRVLFVQGRFQEAIGAFDMQHQYFGDDVPNIDYMYGLTYGYMAKDTGQSLYWHLAEQHFKKYIEHDPEDYYPRVDLSWVLFAQGKYAEMLEVLEPIQDAANPWVQNMLGLAYLNTEAEEKAYDAFTQAEMLSADFTPEVWGQNYPGNNPDDWHEGLRTFREAIVMNRQLIE